MTDSTLNRFLSYGTNAQRLAFTPSVPTPASGPSQAYVWYETDTGDTYDYAAGAWHKINTGGSGNVSGPGTVVNGDMVLFSGTTGTAIKESKIAVTIPATGSTLTIDDGKTLHVTGNVTITGNVSGGANPSATGSDTAVNGTATTFMRSDGAPAIQKTSSSVFGLCKVDNSTITASSGVISAVASVSPFYYTLTKPAIADFTVRHSASGTYTSGDLGSGRGAYLTSLAPGSNAERLVTAEKALSAGNFTATAFLVPSMNWSEFKSIGLFYRDSSTDKIVGFSYDFDAAATKFRKHRWSDISTFNAQTGYTNVVSDRGANPIWIQLKNVSSTVSMNYSLDGENFMTVTTESLTAYAASPDKIGWILNANDNGAGYGEVDTLSCYSWTLV